MNHRNPYEPTVKSPFPILTAILALGALIALPLWQTPGGAQATVATYSEGVLHVSLPCHNLRPGTGQLRLEILDPDGGGPQKGAGDPAPFLDSLGPARCQCRLEKRIWPRSSDHRLCRHGSIDGAPLPT